MTRDWTDITWRGVPAPRERLTLTRETLRVSTGVRAGTGTPVGSGGSGPRPSTTPLRDMDPQETT